MGKGTDKLYITHSEWASEDTYSASAGSGTRSAKPDSSFKRLPYNFCAIFLQPFTHPVCAIDGTIFDITNILPWLKKHGTNPVTAKPLRSDELIKLHFHRNDEGEMVDPVTFKVFTDNTHIVALKVSGNVFAYDTVERLNIKAKMWRDLVSDEEFTRKDIITIQDPQNVEARNLSSFRYLQDGISTLTEEQRRERDDPSRNVNKKALGNAAAVLGTKESSLDPEKRVGKYLPQNNASVSAKSLSKSSTTTSTATHTSKPSSIPYNAAQHTTGKAAASFTSTGLTPHTSADRALLSDEDYMLKPRRVKTPGYARLHTSLGDLNLELLPEFAPRAVWNFVKLAEKGYYKDVAFHRVIRNFMVQGGDPTGTGKGGTSVWGKNFQDEFDGPLSHDARGVLSMANKGKNTNSSQFFILFRPAKHLDHKHTIFGRVVGGMETLSRIENVEVSDDKRPRQDVLIKDIVVYVDPFAEFQKAKRERDDREREKAEIAESGGTEDDRTTWTGKRVRADGKAGIGADGGGGKVVGKYLGGVQAGGGGGEVVVEEWEGAEEPARKKGKNGGFGNFDAW